MTITSPTSRRSSLLQKFLQKGFFWHTCWRAAKAPARLNIKRASFTNMLYLINDRYTWNTFIFVINTKLKRHCVRNLFKSSILIFFRTFPARKLFDLFIEISQQTARSQFLNILQSVIWSKHKVERCLDDAVTIVLYRFGSVVETQREVMVYTIRYGASTRKNLYVAKVPNKIWWWFWRFLIWKLYLTVVRQRERNLTVRYAHSFHMKFNVNG